MKSGFWVGAAFVAALTMSGCTDRGLKEAHPMNRPAARQFIVLMDLSLSRSAEMRADGDAFLGRLSKSLSFGDHITVMQVQQVGLRDHPKRWSDDMPVPSDPSFVTSRDQKALATEQGTVEIAAKSLSAGSPDSTVLHTDLFTTLFLAGEAAHDYQSRPTTVVLLSDMLQSANGVEMDHGKRMPAPGWIEAQRQSGLLPKLPGACVMVVGADGTTKDGARIRDFWESYFSAAGAKLPLENYRVTPPSNGDVRCA